MESNEILKQFDKIIAEQTKQFPGLFDQYPEVLNMMRTNIKKYYDDAKAQSPEAFEQFEKQMKEQQKMVDEQNKYKKEEEKEKK